jgi:CDGSH-type Zn-finger protein
MKDPVTIRCRENGPLVVIGDVRILDHEGNELSMPPGKEKLALCRCGRSQTKPFCDGSHRDGGFVSPSSARPDQ